MNAATSRAGIVLAAIAAAGCQKKTTIDELTSRPDESPAANAPAATTDPVQLAVTVDKPVVALGDDVVFHVKLTNTGSSALSVNVPRIDRASMTLRVRGPDGGVATISRNHADLDPRSGRMIPQANDVKVLDPGKSLVEDVATVAVEAGKIAFTPSYVRQASPVPLVAPTIEVTVNPADPKRPRLGVTLDTTQGPFTAAFRPDVAYNTVESFASLVKKGFYSNVKFHRILPDFMAQGGDPKGTGEGGPGYFIPLETTRQPKLLHTRGVLSMARTGIPDSGGSQFFIMFSSHPDLDSQYATFGEMTDGEETLKRMQAVPRDVNPTSGEPSVPKVDVSIKTAKLVNLP